jgi:hypothetical protein
LPRTDSGWFGGSTATSNLGTRFNGDGIITLIKAQHAAGKRFEWNVTEPDVHISGNTAWIAYINKGSVTDANAMTCSSNFKVLSSEAALTPESPATSVTSWLTG